MFKRFSKSVTELIQHKTTVVFVVMLFVIVFTRFQVMYLNSTQVQKLPESVFAMDRVGRDLLDGVILSTFAELDHRPLYTEVLYGRGLSSVIGIFILPLQSAGICTESKIVNCANSIYMGLVLFVMIGFFAAVIFSPYGENLISAALILITFFLGMSGSLGLDRGNLDILFSLLLFFGVLARFRSSSQSIIGTASEAILLALMANTKITILPFAAVFLLTSAHLLWFFVIFVTSFIGFTYMPILFLAPASLWDSFYAASAANKVFPDMLWTWCAPWNHTIFSVATLAVNCSRGAVLRYRQYSTTVVIFVGGLLFVVVVAPLRHLIPYVRRNFTYIRIRKLYNQSHQGIFLLLLCLATASVNLLPSFAYAFRLYYSLVCILAAWYIVRDQASRRALVLSSVFLLMKGLWIPENKIINIAVFLHFSFLIAAAVGIVREQMGKARGRIMS